jgi:hypothetical protein
MRALFAGLLALVGLAAAPADGTYFKNLNSRPAYFAHQQAIIKYHQGETIYFIRNTVHGGTGTYGWVVPVPATPNYVKPVRPGYIDASLAQLRPRVQTAPDPPTTPDLLLLLVAAALAVTAAHRYRQFPSSGRFVRALAEQAAVGLLAVTVHLSFPEISVKRTSKFSGEMAKSVLSAVPADIVDRHYGEVGNYTVTALKGSDLDAIERWLTARQIPIPPSARPVLESYAQKGWSFLAAEVTKNEPTVRPHPLKIVLPGIHRVYPMRLTGLQQEPLRLELLVVDQSTCPVAPLAMLRTKLGIIDVAVPETLVYRSPDAQPDPNEAAFTEWRSSIYRLVGSNQTATYLRAEVTPQQMTQDFTVGAEPYRAVNIPVYDADSAWRHMVGTGLLAAGAMAVVAGLVLALVGSSTLGLGLVLVAALLAGVGVPLSWRTGVHVEATPRENVLGAPVSMDRIGSFGR